jgi:hypothetical protein
MINLRDMTIDARPYAFIRLRGMSTIAPTAGVSPG